jgi:hypothetical protein
MTQKYYEFNLAGEGMMNGRPCWILNVKPRHDEKNMIKGKAWVDKETYLTQQLQGEMAKTPSWWLKKVEMTIQFGDAAGTWIPTGTYVIADVRFVGKHVLTSQALKVEPTDQLTERGAAPSRYATEIHNSRRFAPTAPASEAGAYVPVR